MEPLREIVSWTSMGVFFGGYLVLAVLLPRRDLMAWRNYPFLKDPFGQRRTTGFIIGGRHRRVGHPLLTRLVWTCRIAILIGLAAQLSFIWHGQ